MALLDCRDTRISLWQEHNAIHSPGFVAAQGSEYLFGDDARKQSRLRPRDTSSRFWWQLSTQPLKPALGAARHTADLVHSHLRHVHEKAGTPESLTLAVPDNMPREQLSLLLGVAQACSFEVAGLVSRSVLLASTSAALAHNPRILHVEAQLNQTILNELVAEDGTLHLARSTPLPASGLLALQERCVSAIASAFIQQTRFDPRRSAESEQSLYNELPAILDAVRARGEASVDIAGHRCRVTSATLAGATDRLLSALGPALDENLPLLIDRELEQLPGVEKLDGQVTPLGEAALWEAWLTQREQVEHGGEDVHLIDRLHVNTTTASAEENPATPAARSPSEAPQGIPQESVVGATHVLLGTRALPLRGPQVDLGGGFSLEPANGGWVLRGEGALINGLPGAPGQAVILGDTLALGTAGHGRLIEVLD